MHYFHRTMHRPPEESIRGGEAREKMIALNRNDPAAIDERFPGLKAAPEEAVKEHSAL